MEQKIFDAVKAELSPLFTENGFTENDNSFIGETTAFKIEYDAEKNLFLLLCAEVVDGSTDAYAVASSYLFDENGTLSDAAAVGIDFADTVKTKLGLSRRVTRSADVALPTKSGADTPGMDDLCNRMLAIFPAYKEQYKENVQENGEFLYVNFFLDTVAVDIRNLIAEGNDKKLKKIYDALNELYVKGDRNVGNVIVVAILGGAVKGDKELTEKLLCGLGDYQYLKSAVRNITDRTAKDKRLKEMYGI